MNKKKILSIGAIALAFGMGVAAVSAGSLLLPSSNVVTAEGDTQTFLDYKGSIPVDESVVPEWQNLQDIQFQFTELANAGTFPGLMVNRACAEKIQVQRSTMGTEGSYATVMEIDPSDEAAVYIDSKWQTRVHVKLPEPLTIYGSVNTITYYKVILPAGVVAKDGTDPGALNPDNPGEFKAMINPQEETNIIIKKIARYTTTPGSGSTASILMGGLLDASINFANNTELTLNNDSKATLYLVEPGQGYKRTEKGQYTLSVDGSKIAMSLDGGVQPAVPTSNNYYCIVVPADVINAKAAGDFWGQDVPEIEIDNLGLTFISASSITLEGLNPLDEPYANATDFPTTFKMIFPQAMEFGKNIMGTAYSVTGYIKSGNTTLANITGTPNAEKTELTWVMNAATSTTSITGNQNLWPAGNYTIEIAANKLIDPNNPSVKNTTAVVFGPWTVEAGLTKDPVNSNNIACNTGSTYYTCDWEGEGNSATSTNIVKYKADQQFKVAALNGIPSEVGVSCVKLNFIFGCFVNTANETAKITLVKEGETEPMLELTTATEVNGDHLWYGTSAPNQNNKGKTPTSGQTSWLVYYKLTDDIAYIASKPNISSAKCYIPEYITQSGTYTLHADEGFFVDKDGLPSEAVDVNFTIVGGIDYTLVPENKSKVADLSEIKIVYPEGATIEINDGLRWQLQPPTPLSVNPLPWYGASAEGNVVTLTAETPLQALSAYQMKLTVPAGSWKVTYNNVTEPNPTIEMGYIVDEVPQGTVEPAPGEAVIVASELSKIVYTSSIPVKSIKGDAYLYHLAPAEEEGAAPSKEKVATYTCTLEEDENENVIESNTLEWITTSEVSELESGEYEFVIPAGAFAVMSLGSNVPTTKDFAYAYKVVSTPKFDKIFTMQFPMATTVYDYQLGPDGLSNMQFTYLETKLAKSDNADLKMVLSYKAEGEEEAEVLGEIAANSAAVELEEPMEFGTSLLDGSLYIDFAQVAEGFPFTSAGTYTLEIPNGFFTLDGVNVEGTTVEITVNKKPVDFTYTLDPEAGGDVETLESIILTFPNASDINYASDSEHPVATLESEDGSLVLDCIYPQSDWMNTLTLKFGDANTQWVKGKYTLTVHKGSVSVDNPNFDDSELESGNFEGLTAEYNYIGETVVEMGDITDYLNLSIPSSLEANTANTTSPFGSTGMGVVMYGLKADFERVDGAEFIQMLYQAEEGSEPEVLATVNPANENQLLIFGAGIMDDDLPSFDPVKFMCIMFNGDGEGGLEEDQSAYNREGYYHVVFPDGCFKAEGKLLKGTTITYHFTQGGSEFNYEYSVTPDPEEAIKLDDAKTTFFTNGISLVVEGSEAIESLENSATLTCPDNTVITKNLPVSNWTNKLTWKFGTNNTEWLEGQYVFEIFPGKIYVDQTSGYIDADVLNDSGVEGNFPGLKAVYTVSSTVGVWMIGIDKADSYNVYTVDGKVVKLNALPSEMVDLQPGLYIINGKKALVRK